MGEDGADYSQHNTGSPYLNVHANFSMKYVSASIGYDMSFLNYKVIDFDDNLAWYNPEKNIVTQSLKLDLSFMLPVKNMALQLGIGYKLDLTQLDSQKPIKASSPYFLYGLRDKSF
jgi:hypothetical protein